MGVATVSLAFRGSQWAWLAAAVLMFVGPPRVTTSYLGFILVAVVVMLDEGRPPQPAHAG